MKFASTIITLAALFTVAIALPPTSSSTVEPVRQNNFYDNGNESMNNVACSNGANGLVTKFPPFNKLPTFPFIGGGFTVHNWNSPECGSCWELTDPATGVTIFVTAIDTISSGFSLSHAAVSNLTRGNAGPTFSEVNVDATEVPRHICGL